LSGRIHTVLDTRPTASPGFAAVLEKAGIGVAHVPLIRIERVQPSDETAEVLQKLPSFDGILLTSMNGVRHFATLLRDAAIAPDRLPPVFVVGPKTADLARTEGFAPQALPSASYGATMATELPDVRDRRFLQPCADIAREETADGIRARGGTVEQLVVYRTLPPSDADAVRLAEIAAHSGYDCAAFFSPSAVRHYAALLPGNIRPDAAVAVIGNTTAAEAKACGMRVDILPPQQTAEALAEAIVAWA